MDWIDFAWTVMFTFAMSMAAIHAVVWFRKKSKSGHLAFAVACFAIGIATYIELATFRAESVDQYITLVRWFHVPMFVMLVSLVFFVRLYFNLGRLWLALLFCVLRFLYVAANLTTAANLQFIDVTALRTVSVLGAHIVAPIGTATPLMLLSQLSMLVFVVYMVDAILEARRKWTREKAGHAARIIGAIIITMILGSFWAAWAATHPGTPLMVVPAFTCVLLVMSYELGLGVVRNYDLVDDLRVRELQMDLASQKSPVGLWTYSLDCREFRGNPQARKLLGFGPDESIDGNKLLARIHEEDHEGLETALTIAQANDGNFVADFRVPDDDGGFRWLTTAARFDVGDQVGRKLVHGVMLDITERHQSDERFRQVVEASPIAKLVVERDGRIVFSNNQAQRIFGYDKEQLCLMNVDQLVPQSSRGRHAEERKDYAKNPNMRRMGGGRELFGIHRDGHEIPLEIGIASMPSDHGLQFLATITDITERKAMERESASQREELAHLSRVALLSELSGSLAHELNQPLTAILSNAQAAMRFMQHTPPNLDEVRESLVNIVESDKRAGEVIRRLRAMLRKDPPEFQKLDINEVIQDVLRIIRSDLLNRSVEMRLEMAPELPFIQGDRVQLQQVVLNLIMNGSDAMEGVVKGRILTIRTQALPSGGVEVQISDVGKGIPESDLERIFSPFVTSKREGMGLGLAVCTTIMQAHRGRLWASNNAGPGATLHLELPHQ